MKRYTDRAVSASPSFARELAKLTGQPEAIPPFTSRPAKEALDDGVIPAVALAAHAAYARVLDVLGLQLQPELERVAVDDRPLSARVRRGRFVAEEERTRLRAGFVFGPAHRWRSRIVAVGRRRTFIGGTDGS